MAAKLTNVQRLERVEAHVRKLLERVHKLEGSGVSLTKQIWLIDQKISAKQEQREYMYRKYGQDMATEQPEVHAEYTKLRKEIRAMKEQKSKI